MQRNSHKHIGLAFCSLILAWGCSGGGGGIDVDADAGADGGSATGGKGGKADAGVDGRPKFDGGVAGAGGTTPGFDAGPGGVGGGPGCTATDSSQCGMGFCEFPDGTCGRLGFLAPARDISADPPAGLVAPPGGFGFCLGRPNACPANYAPVCGCDGVTYGNDCGRRANGVSKLHDGACEAPQVIVGEGQGCGKFSPDAEFVCKDNLFCEFDTGTCNMPNAKGTCRRRPEACLAVSAPVCGCDGITYGNDCQRRRAGATLASGGACQPVGAQLGEVCGPGLNINCSSGLVCDPRAFQCGAAQWVGTCKRAPTGICTREFAPVCGCDGRTYSNDCERLNSGIAQGHPGECVVKRFVSAGQWGGSSVSLDATNPQQGGQLKFDCGHARILSPLEVAADGTFTWKAQYVFVPDPARVQLDVALPVRDMIITGQVQNSNSVMTLTAQLVGSMTQIKSELVLNKAGVFRLCL